MKCRKRLRDYGLGLLLVLVSNAGIFGKSKPVSEIPPQRKPKKYEIAVYNNSNDAVEVFISSAFYCRGRSLLFGDLMGAIEGVFRRDGPRTVRERVKPGSDLCSEYKLAPHETLYANIRDFKVEGTSAWLQKLAKVMSLKYYLVVWNPKTQVASSRMVAPGTHFYVYPDDMQHHKKIKGRAWEVPVIKESNRPA